MTDIKFTSQHEWIRVSGDVATIGISAYAQEKLGDVVYVELPETDRTIAKGEEIATVESVKAASEVYAPVSGTIVETNPDLDGEPGLVNRDPQAAGWFMKIKLSDTDDLEDLMDQAAYDAFVQALD